MYPTGKYSDLTELERSELSNLILSNTKLCETSCTEWLGSDNGRGYGIIIFKRLKFYAARFLMSASVGRDLDRNEYVCHKCDNPPCINMNHLFIGTPSDNAQDMLKKGRHWMQKYPERAKMHARHLHISGNQAKGERQSSAKLTSEIVLQIRSLYSSGKGTHKSFAQKYGVTKQAITALLNRRTWKHI